LNKFEEQGSRIEKKDYPVFGLDLRPILSKRG
jgi:hypothetical protein